MKRTLISLLFVGLFTGVGTSAMAQNVTAGDQPKDGSQTNTNPEMGIDMHDQMQNDMDEKMQYDVNKPGTTGAADESVPKQDKNAASAKAEKEYQAAKQKCDDLKSSQSGACLSAAQAKRDEALKQAKKQSKDKGAANESDTATPTEQRAEIESTDKDASKTTN